MSYQSYSSPCEYGQGYGYSHPNTASSGATTAATATATATPTMEWNGSEWVTRTAAAGASASTGLNASGGHIQYTSNFSNISSTNTSMSMSMSMSKNMNSPSLPSSTSAQVQVQRYTQYYHGWIATLKDYESRFSSLPQDPQEKSKIDWARYYADISSRVAHHYFQYSQSNSNLQSQSQSQLQLQLNVNTSTPPPPPFDLPPEPPILPQPEHKTHQAHGTHVAQPQPQPTVPSTAAAAATTSTRDPKYQSQGQTQTQSQTKTDLSNNSESSLTHFVKRSLAQCNTDQQRRQVQSEIEKVIAKAIQQNTLHTKNWSLEPLITLSSRALPANTHSHTKPSRNTGYANADAYYGPATNSHPSLSSDNTCSRYSYSSSTPTLTTASTNTHSNKRKTKDDGWDRSNRTLQKRQARFDGPGGLKDVAFTSNTAQNRYAKYMGLATIGSNSNKKVLTEQDYEQMTVKGTCTTLEKEYLRLTAPPRPELVRPQHILKQHLQHLEQEYYDYPNSSSSNIIREKRDYLWFCSQLKAIRQDLTIQRIRNAFAVQVYETHARIALQEGDLNEFNQCQTQLKELYTQHPQHEHEDEFMAYRLLYHILLTTNEKSEGAAASEISKLLLLLTVNKTKQNYRETRKDQATEHALKVRKAVALVDFLAFFRLHTTAPNLGKFITGRMLPTMRLRALKRIVKAYRPSLEVSAVTGMLGFSKVEEARAWIESCGAKLDGENVLTKDSDGKIHEPEQQTKNSLLA